MLKSVTEKGVPNCGSLCIRRTAVVTRQHSANSVSDCTVSHRTLSLTLGILLIVSVFRISGAGGEEWGNIGV